MKHLLIIAFLSFSFDLAAQSGGVGISSKPYQHLTSQAPRMPKDSSNAFGSAPDGPVEIEIEIDEESLRVMKCGWLRSEMIEGKEELRIRVRERVIKELGKKMLKNSPRVDAMVGIDDKGGIRYVSMNAAYALIPLNPIVEDEIRKLTWEPVECEGRLAGHEVWVQFEL
ncbi:MAG: hypothetical protein M3R08_07490 [Bacteroidota bacterium]|nr:hypothetical protein [Bacteroidota bacterium]